MLLLDRSHSRRRTSTPSRGRRRPPTTMRYISCLLPAPLATPSPMPLLGWAPCMTPSPDFAPFKQEQFASSLFNEIGARWFQSRRCSPSGNRRSPPFRRLRASAHSHQLLAERGSGATWPLLLCSSKNRSHSPFRSSTSSRRRRRPPTTMRSSSCRLPRHRIRRGRTTISN